MIAATNRDLQKMVDEKKFREDLWFRLNVVRIVIPPLRDRRSDIPLLAQFFLNKYNARYERDVKLSESGVKAMQEYTWPGNVRQLQHLIERLTILAPRERIDGEAIADALNCHGAARTRRRDRWPKPKPSRFAACWRRQAATKAAPRRFWESSARRCTASWSG